MLGQLNTNQSDKELHFQSADKSGISGYSDPKDMIVSITTYRINAMNGSSKGSFLQRARVWCNARRQPSNLARERKGNSGKHRLMELVSPTTLNAAVLSYGVSSVIRTSILFMTGRYEEMDMSGRVYVAEEQPRT